MDKCPVCGKEYTPAPMHIYRITTKHGSHLVCSWGCQRAWEKERDEKRKKKKEG